VAEAFNYEEGGREELSNRYYFIFLPSYTYSLALMGSGDEWLWHEI
jgi:hypothetical protein